MRPIRLASRYAKALFELAGEQKIREEVFRDMNTMATVCRESRDFRIMLQSPVIRYDKKNKVMHELFAKRFHATTMAYTDLISRKRREVILPEIAEQYVLLYREWKNIKSAVLTTAIAVDEKMKAHIIALLQEQVKAEIELECVVKPELLGGFVISVEDRQLDASIIRKIKKLTREFNINIYEKKI